MGHISLETNHFYGLDHETNHPVFPEENQKPVKPDPDTPYQPTEPDEPDVQPEIIDNISIGDH